MMRFMMRLWLLLALMSGVATAQLEGRAASEYIYHVADQIEAARAEREAELRSLFLVASTDRQQLASEVLNGGRDAGRPALRPIDFDVLHAARVALSSGEREVTALASLAASLDLRVAPGLFVAREEGHGEALTVSVSQLWRAKGQDASMSLWWISPTGERTRARAEPITAGTIATGFEMYIRPPLSAPGLWRLGLELEAGGERATGIGTPVECLAGFEDLRRRLRGTDPLGAGAAGRRLALDLQLLVLFGVRSPGLVSLDDQRAVLSRAGAQRARLIETGAGLDAIVLELTPSAGSQAEGEEHATRAVLRASDAARPAFHVTAGALGKSWSGLASDPALRVFAASLPASERSAEAWLKLCEELKRDESIDELVLVASGELALLLPRALQLAERPVLDGLVLTASPATHALPGELPCDMLLIEGGAPQPHEEHGVQEERRWTHLTSDEADLLLALRVPSLIAGWMARE